MRVNLVVAMARESRGIGQGGTLPWRLSKELEYFRKLTTTTKNIQKKNAVIMGRKTWESIPERFRPLKGRVNIVLSRNENFKINGVQVAKELDEALAVLRDDDNIENAFVIGGSSLYKQAMKDCDSIYLTRINSKFDNCDVFFPEIDERIFQQSETISDITPQGIQKEGDIEYEYMLYVRRNEADPTKSNSPPPKHIIHKRHEEYQYLDMVRHVLENGVEKGDRTGTGTISTFGTSMRYSLRDNTMPLLTTKRTFWRGVAEELLWFISGDTNGKTLSDKGIHIWDGNGSREFLDKLGLTDREEGDLGPVYGFQWRHFGAEYGTMHDDYNGKGVDQLSQLIHTIKTNPNDRRMILSAWNPAAFHLMALPPCHMFAQFYVANGELSCQMYQRSADMGLGVPFNIASYALLTHLLAKCTGLKAGEFIHIIGDCHVYKDHVEPLKEQLEREPRPFPKLEINTNNTDIDGFKYSDFNLIDYKPHKSIKMKMSV